MALVRGSSSYNFFEKYVSIDTNTKKQVVTYYYWYLTTTAARGGRSAFQRFLCLLLCLDFAFNSGYLAQNSSGAALRGSCWRATRGACGAARIYVFVVSFRLCSENVFLCFFHTFYVFRHCPSKSKFFGPLAFPGSSSRCRNRVLRTKLSRNT